MPIRVKILKVEHRDPKSGCISGPWNIRLLIDGQETRMLLRYRRFHIQTDEIIRKHAIMSFENKLIKKHPEYEEIRNQVKEEVWMWFASAPGAKSLLNGDIIG